MVKLKLVKNKHDNVKDSTLILLSKGENLNVKAQIRCKVFSDFRKTN